MFSLENYTAPVLLQDNWTINNNEYKYSCKKHINIPFITMVGCGSPIFKLGSSMRFKLAFRILDVFFSLNYTIDVSK